MKICLINSLFALQARGGAEQVVLEQARSLLKQGHSVFVLTSAVGGSAGFEVIESIGVFRLPQRNLFTFFSYSRKPLWLRLIWLGLDMFNIFTARQAVKILVREKPDLVITHNLRGLTYLLPRYIRKLNIKHHHYLHDIQLVYPSGVLFKNHAQDFVNIFFLRRWYEKICRCLFNSPDKVISRSQWLLDFYISRGFFENSEQQVKKPELKHDSLKTLKRDNQQLRLLYVGQVEKHKGVLFLVQALKRFENKNLRFKIDMVGDGSKLAEAKQLAAGDDRFIFRGQVSHDNLVKFYQAADLTIVPSLTYENAPTVIFESIAAGTPVLAANIGGIPEIIENGVNGWLFEAGSEKNLIEKLGSIL
jgi:glycosyltransferase involved in cell wall biosynthesis